MTKVTQLTKSEPNPNGTEPAEPAEPKSVFGTWLPKLWQHRFNVTLTGLTAIHGGVPADPQIAKSWIGAKFGNADALLADRVAEAIATTETDLEGAVEQVASAKGLTVFRCDNKGVYLPGAYVKAMLKEAASGARAADHLPAKVGTTSKGVLSFIAEHVSVVENRLYLLKEDGTVAKREDCVIEQRLIHTFRGSSIGYTETLYPWQVRATFETDFEFTDAQIAAVWLQGERNGLGANRSQGAGRFAVTQWDRITGKSK